MSRPTTEQHIAHLRAGANECLVCDASPLSGSWTDYNGQIRCTICGMTYQILGSHLKDSFLTKHGLAKSDIARRYCDSFTLFPLVRDYWTQTRRKVPFGDYLGDSPVPREDHLEFRRWLVANAHKYKEEYADDLRWSAIEAVAPGENEE